MAATIIGIIIVFGLGFIAGYMKGLALIKYILNN